MCIRDRSGAARAPVCAPFPGARTARPYRSRRRLFSHAAPLGLPPLVRSPVGFPLTPREWRYPSVRNNCAEAGRYLRRGSLSTRLSTELRQSSTIGDNSVRWACAGVSVVEYPLPVGLDPGIANGLAERTAHHVEDFLDVPIRVAMLGGCPHAALD